MQRSKLLTEVQVADMLKGLRLLYPEANFLQEHELPLSRFLLKSQINHEQFALLRNGFIKALDKKMYAALDFYLWDFFDRLNHVEMSDVCLLTLTNFILGVEAVIKSIDFLATLKKPDLYDRSSSDEKKIERNFRDSVDLMNLYRAQGVRLIDDQLESLFLFSNDIVNIAKLISVIKLLKNHWYSKVDTLCDQGIRTLLIDDYFKRFNKMILFIRDVFSIRSGYCEMKKSNRTFFSFKGLSVEKESKLYEIENSVEQALGIISIDSSVEMSELVLPIMKRISHEVNSSMYGKSDLSKKIDEVMLKYEPFNNCQIKLK